MTSILQFFLALLVLGFSTTSRAEPGDRAGGELAGHYHLNGMREVGSELVLHGDGRFHWSIAYGEIDREVEGEWSLDAGTVTLTRRAAAVPVSFRAADALPWDGRADEMLTARTKARAREAFRRRCPIAVLQEGEGHAVSDAAFAAPPTEEQLLRSKEFADFTRARAQAVLDRLRSRPEWQQDPKTIAEVDSALGAHAQADMRRVYQIDSARAAGMSIPPAPAPLVFPPECEPDGPPAESTPGRGALVVVFDPERNIVAKGFAVEAAYDRGPPVRDVVGARGAAFLPLAGGRRIVALTIVPRDGTVAEGARRFPVTIAEPTIQVIHADLARTDPPFDRLQLAVEEGGRLHPLEGLRGHYVRNGAQ